jgi:hypothetical protein
LDVVVNGEWPGLARRFRRNHRHGFAISPGARQGAGHSWGFIFGARRAGRARSAFGGPSFPAASATTFTTTSPAISAAAWFARGGSFDFVFTVFFFPAGEFHFFGHIFLSEPLHGNFFS